MLNTTKYILVRYHRAFLIITVHTIQVLKAPNSVDDDDDVIKITNRKYNKAKNEETKYMFGDHARCIINRKQFEKGTLAKWSTTVHKIVSNTEHTYKLENGNDYK